MVPGPSSVSSLTSPSRVPTIRRLPKASRRLVADKFSALLEGVVSHNDVSSWVSLLSFATNCLYSPRRGGKRWSLATIINKQIENGTGPPQRSQPHGNISCQPRPLSPDYLREAVSSCLEEVDFRGAIHLASASDALLLPLQPLFRPFRRNTPPPASSSFPSPPASVSGSRCRTGGRKCHLVFSPGFFRRSGQPEASASERLALHQTTRAWSFSASLLVSCFFLLGFGGQNAQAG